MPKINKIFMTCREGILLLLQVSKLLKIHLVNLFGMWKIGASKVGVPSSHVTSLGPLFVRDARDGLWPRFLGELEKRDVKII